MSYFLEKRLDYYSLLFFDKKNLQIYNAAIFTSCYLTVLKKRKHYFLIVCFPNSKTICEETRLAIVIVLADFFGSYNYVCNLLPEAKSQKF